MPESVESNSTKCLSAFLSRLLCSGGLPTHPSEQLIESSTVKLKLDDQKPLEDAKRGSNPGVVARLMGLESFPLENHHKERTLGDYFRSRSVNSIDFLSHLDPVKPRNLRHRRVRTSVSFRDGFDHEFSSVVFLLEEEFQGKMRERSGEEERESQEKRNSVYGKNVEIVKEKRKSELKKKRDLEGKRRADLKERRPVIKSEGKLKKKKKKKKNLAHKLNFDFKKMQSDGAAPEVASPRKHQSFQTANSRSPCTNSSLSEGVIIAENNEGKMEINENLCYKKVVEEICVLAEDGVRENWIYATELKFGNFEEICQQFGQEILEVLLAQFLDELFVLFREEITIN